MYAQTIALFRYLLLGITNRRLMVLMGVLYLIGVSLSVVIFELAIVNSQSIAAAFLAEFIRYSLVILILLLTASNIAGDFEYRQFERLLTMPVARWQYILAQFLLTLVVTGILVLPSLLILTIYANFEVAGYWTVALWLELILVGLLGLLAILSLEKIPSAFLLALAIYLLSRISPFVSQMLTESVRLSDGELASRFAQSIFNGILYLLPGTESFAQNDVLLIDMEKWSLLLVQGQNVVVYALFILSACLIDFYRKEFNL